MTQRSSNDKLLDVALLENQGVRIGLHERNFLEAAAAIARTGDIEKTLSQLCVHFRIDARELIPLNTGNHNQWGEGACVLVESSVDLGVGMNDSNQSYSTKPSVQKDGDNNYWD